MTKKRVDLSPSQKHSVYEMRLAGEKIKDIAAAFGIAESSTYRIISQERKKQEHKKQEQGQEQGDNMGRGEKVIAGNKKTGRLVAMGDRKTYKGTCLVGTGMKSKEFTSLNPHMAEKVWQKWCDELRESEKAFLDAYEPRVEVEETEDTGGRKEGDTYIIQLDQTAMTGKVETRPLPDEPVDIEPAHVPEISVRIPWKDVAEEQRQRIEELERQVEYLQGRLDYYDSLPSANANDPAYLLWAKTDTPKVYGLYPSMDKALKKVDQLNEVARFLGNSDAFEVEEVEWK